MQPFRTLRGRLIALVAALLALVIGGVAIVSTRVVHKEIRRIEIRTRGAHPLPPFPPVGTQPPARTVDVWFFWIFVVAAAVGVLLAVVIARWTTRPILRLTAATRRMEQGDLTVRVIPAGGLELAELAQSFNAMAAALDRNEELRRRMVGDVAHELRAPLTNIRCELESIQDGLTQPTRERIESLHEEAMHLTRLVDDLQDLALAEAGKLELAPERVMLATLVHRAATALESQARAHAVQIVVAGEDLVVIADPRRTVQILGNLLTNAVTHMQQPGEVRVTWERSGEEAVVKVIDQGVGIAPADLARIFERFYRVDASRSRATGGAGLGLSIVRQLVAAHGGRVWAESEVDQGSTFAFTLPLA